VFLEQNVDSDDEKPITVPPTDISEIHQ